MHKSPRPLRAELRVVFAVLLFLMALVIVAVLGFERPLYFRTPLKPIPESVIVATALVYLGSGFLALATPPAFGMGLTTTGLTGLVGVILASAVLTPTLGEYWDAPSYVDEKFGLRALPGTVSRHARLPDYSVSYTFDDRGFRAIDAPTDPLGTVVFLGCSFTFGLGVEDDETYPAILAREWPRYAVRNLAISGWGTTEALVLLRDAFEQSPAPTLALYGYSSLHLCRNYLRKEWFEGSPAVRRVQYFEIEEGTLVYKGSRPVGELPLVPMSPELSEKETAITVELILAMEQECRRHQVPFFTVLLTSPMPEPEPDPVVEQLRARGISLIDAKGVAETYFDHDPHPTVEWHRAVAKVMAGDPRLAFLASGNLPGGKPGAGGRQGAP